MKLSILASLIAGAAAFAPSQQASSTTALRAADFSDDIGVTAPLGVWDPLNVLTNSMATDAKIERLRAVEIKHGRVAMLAVVGYLVTKAGVRLPGLEDVPSGFAAWDALPGEVLGQMGITWIFMEMANRDQTGNAEFPGDFRNGYLDFGWDSQSEEWKKNKRTIELNQGRAAQMGILGLMIHEYMGNVDDILP